MTHLFLSIILIFAAVFSVNCQSEILTNVSQQSPQPAYSDKTGKDELLAKIFQNKTGKKMPYRLFLPTGYDKNKKYPLILWLHGGGGRGNDNLKQITDGNTSGFQAWVNSKHQAKYPSIVVAPQCPTGEQWTSWDDKVKLTEQIKIVMELLEDLQKTYSVDRERLYVSGQSMGGFAAWALISEYPDMFAAAVPVCAGGNETKAAQMINTPIWAFHGELDTAVKVERSRRMIAALKKAGGTPLYTEYKGEGHVIWDRVFSEPELLPWVFAQKKTAAKER